MELPSASVRSTETFGAILGVHELTGGRLLVNDGGRWQVKLLESTLALATIVVDTVRGAPNFYGPMPRPLIPFLRDSALFPDVVSRTLSVIGPKGAIVRALALPNPGQVTLIRRAASDNTGRLIFPVNATISRPAGNGFAPVVADSAPLVRIDLALRQTDTIAYVARPLAGVDVMRNGVITTYWNPDPLRAIDEWAVLTDGSVALVRGHDYHIDLIRSGRDNDHRPRRRCRSTHASSPTRTRRG